MEYRAPHLEFEPQQSNYSWSSVPGDTLQCAIRSPIFRNLSLASEMAIILTWLGGTFVTLVCILPFIWIPVARGDHRWYTPPRKPKPAKVDRTHRWIQFGVSVMIVVLVLQAGYAGDMNLRYYRYCREPIDRAGSQRPEDAPHSPSHIRSEEPWKGHASYSKIPGAFALSMIIWIFGILEFSTLLRSIVNVALGYTKRQTFLGWWWWPPTPMFALITSPLIIVLKCCLLPLARHAREDSQVVEDVDFATVFISPTTSKRAPASRKHSRGNSRNTSRSASTVRSDKNKKGMTEPKITEVAKEK